MNSSKSDLRVNLSAAYIFTAILMIHRGLCIRISDRTSLVVTFPTQQRKVVVFALGSFWISEAAFGCLDGVVRTTSGYAGGAKSNPEYRSLGDHAESVQVEYDPRIISYTDLVEVFWNSHDPTQVFGQGPDVGNQYRSIIFTNGSEEYRLAMTSKEKQQIMSRGSIVTTQIQQLGIFYPAEPEHQKFELKRNPFLRQLIGNSLPEELEKSTLAAKLNGYAADLCPPTIQTHIDSKIHNVLAKGWPLIREI